MLFNCMGYCFFYEEIEVVDIGFVREILVLKELCGVVILSNILFGVFVQVVCDNNDVNEEILDGKNIIYVIIFVFYQVGQFGLRFLIIVYGDYLIKR